MGFRRLCCLAWCFLALAIASGPAVARVYEIHPATVASDEEFERVANALQPGDELVLHGGTYSQTGRRAVTAKGTPDRPILIRAAAGESPLLTRPAEHRDDQNDVEFVDCAHLVIRGLRFRGGSSGVRFIRGHDVTFEDCEIFETGNNALTMNSGDCHAFVIRRNHIHHTGLSNAGPTEGEGMYIGCHSGSCRTTDSLIEGNYIHHLRGTSDGGNDGIEIKFGSHGNVVRNNVIHDTNIGRQYPGIFVYGGGPGTNVVEGNVIWNAGEGIQAVSDAVVRNNVIFNCSATGITAAPHAAVPRLRHTILVHNTIFNVPVGIRMRWANATDVICANNAVYCPGAVALDTGGLGSARLRHNCVAGRLVGAVLDGSRVLDGGTIAAALTDAGRGNFWPRPGSPLIGQADPEYVPERDFNEGARAAPFDVGAYETDGRDQNPGWTIQAGFKGRPGRGLFEEFRPRVVRP
jgi:Right handed beta helix region